MPEARSGGSPVNARWLIDSELINVYIVGVAIDDLKPGVDRD